MRGGGPRGLVAVPHGVEVALEAQVELVGPGEDGVGQARAAELPQERAAGRGAVTDLTPTSEHDHKTHR